MKLYNIFTSSIWSAIGYVFSKGAILLVISLVSIILSIDDFAKFNLFLIVVNVFAGVIGLSMNVTANRYAKDTDNLSSILFLSITVSILGGFIYLMLEYLYFHMFLDNIERIISFFIIIFSIYSNSLSGFFYASGQFKKYAVIYSIQGIMMVILCYCMGRYFGLKGILLGLLLSYLFTTIFSIFYFKKRNILFRFKRDLILRSSSKVLIPGILSGALFQPAILITAFLIDKYANANEVIAYTIANQFRMTLGILPITLSSVLLKLLVDNKNYYLEKIERVNFSLSYYPIILLSIVLLLFKDIIISLINNLDANVFTICFVFFISGTVITSFKGAVSRKLVSEENGRISILSNLSWFGCFLLIAVVFIPTYGAAGAAFSFLIAQLLHLLAWSPFYIKNNYYCMEFFDYKFFLSIPVYIIMVICVVFNYWVIIFILLLLTIFLSIKEVLLLKRIEK